MPELDSAGDGEDPQRQGESAHRRLRGDQELALIETIGGEACPWQKEELRPELQRHNQADGGSVVVSELSEHQPVLGRALHPGADVGDEGSDDPDPIIVSSQRSKDARKGRRHRGSSALPPWKRPNCRAQSSAIKRAPNPSATMSPVSLNSKSPTRQMRT